jgi:alpha-amylase
MMRSLLLVVRDRTLTLSVALATVALFSAALLTWGEEEPPWWQDAVFYEVFVRSFQDSNGDGIGDLNGLIDRLDYLNDGDPATSTDLGVTALWLMPIMESPSYHGYDVANYYKVDADYGTNADFQRLVNEAHKRGIRVIVDLVLNHTSSMNPWFIASLSRSSPYREWYVWSDANPGYVGPWGEQVWTPRGGAFYYAVFWSGMPDLNYVSPAVTTRMFDVARTWLLDMGADGFRLDAVRHLIEDGARQQDTPATHSWLAEFNAAVKGWAPDGYLVGEIWAEPEITVSYLDHQVDQCFEFSLAEAIVSGVRDGTPARVTSALSRVLGLYPEGLFATFLSNHDQERVMSRLLGSDAKAKLTARMLLTLPGTPFIYYGEEIGMTGTKPDEWIRTPMQWAPTASGGFTTGTPWKSLQTDAAHRTVADQTRDVGSLLSTYRQFIRLRLDHEALRTGSTTLIEAGTAPLVGYVRESEGETLLVLHNLSSSPQPAAVRVPSLHEGAYSALDLLATSGAVPFTVDADGALRSLPITLAAFGTLILRITPT